MKDLITIRRIADELGISYHAARNRLNRNPDTEKYKHKLEHTVVYEREVLRIMQA